MCIFTAKNKAQSAGTKLIGSLFLLSLPSFSTEQIKDLLLPDVAEEIAFLAKERLKTLTN